MLFKVPWGRLNTSLKRTVRGSHRSSSIKKVFLIFSQKSQENSCAGVIFDEVSGWRLETLFIKRFRRRYLFSCKRSRIFYINNIRQNILHKFLKLSKNRCSVKCVTSDFLQFFSVIVKIFISGGQLGTSL